MKNDVPKEGDMSSFMHYLVVIILCGYMGWLAIEVLSNIYSCLLLIPPPLTQHLWNFLSRTTIGRCKVDLFDIPEPRPKEFKYN